MSQWSVDAILRKQVSADSALSPTGNTGGKAISAGVGVKIGSLSEENQISVEAGIRQSQSP